MKKLTMPWGTRETTMESLTKDYIKTMESTIIDAMDIALEQSDTTLADVLEDPTYGPLIKLYQRVLDDAKGFALVAARMQDDRYEMMSSELEAIRSFCKHKEAIDFKRNKEINDKLDKIIDMR